MTQVLMILTECQGQILPKMGKKLNWPYLGCYFTYRLHTWYLILGTKVQHNKAHSMIQVPMTLTFGQNFPDQRSWSKFPKMGQILNNWPYLGCYFTHIIHHIYYHSFVWLIWALSSCLKLR